MATRGETVDATNEGSIHVGSAHHRRALTRIRLQADRAVRAFKNGIEAMEQIVKIARENDARELRPRPSLRKKRSPKGRRP